MTDSKPSCVSHVSLGCNDFARARPIAMTTPNLAVAALCVIPTDTRSKLPSRTCWDMDLARKLGMN